MGDEQDRTYERQARQGDATAKAALVASMLKRQDGQIIVWRNDPNEASPGLGEAHVSLVIGRESRSAGSPTEAWAASALPVTDAASLVSELQALRREVLLVDLARRSAVVIGAKAFAVAVGERVPGRPEPADDPWGGTVPAELLQALGLVGDGGLAPGLGRYIPRPVRPLQMPIQVPSFTSTQVPGMAQAPGGGLGSFVPTGDGLGDFVSELRGTPAETDSEPGAEDASEARASSGGPSGMAPLDGELPEAIVERLLEGFRNMPEGASQAEVERRAMSALGLDPDSSGEFLRLMKEVHPVSDETATRLAVRLIDRARAAGIRVPEHVLRRAEQEKTRHSAKSAKKSKKAKKKA